MSSCTWAWAAAMIPSGSDMIDEAATVVTSRMPSQPRKAVSQVVPKSTGLPIGAPPDAASL